MTAPMPAPHAAAVAAELLAWLQGPFALDARVARGERPVIGLAGESGSGKSTTAEALGAALAGAGVPVTLLHQDHYFRRPPRTNHEARVADLSLVGPHEVALERIAEHLAAFRAGAPGVEAPRVDYPGNRFDTVWHDFAGARLLLVEGTYALFLEGLDARVFLEATHTDTHERRMARNRDLWEPVIDTILAIEHAAIAPQGATADVVISRDFRVRVPRRAPRHEPPRAP
jgi:uridine kinase